VLTKLLEIKKNPVIIFARYIYICLMIILSIIIPGCPPDVTEFALITLRQFITIKNSNNNNNNSNEFQRLNGKEADNNNNIVLRYR
jgi:NADH:ubiquinone oxidoreductase subunit B-like Fe-S oxidoreductase